MESLLEQKFADFLRQARGDQSYVEFGRKLGISKSTLHWAENVRGRVSLKLVEDVARKLKVSLVDVFGDAATVKLSTTRSKRGSALGT